MTAKTKIVLDADVIIHFVKAGQFSLLLDIFPEYQSDTGCGVRRGDGEQGDENTD